MKYIWICKVIEILVQERTFCILACYLSRSVVLKSISQYLIKIIVLEGLNKYDLFQMQYIFLYVG